MTKRMTEALLAGFLAACASAPPPAPRMAARSAAASQLDETTARSRYTVLVFVSRHCPTVRVHDARLRELFARYHPLGVSFLAVDPEIDSSPAVVRAEGTSRGYPFPVLRDEGALLAREFDAEYASQVLLFDGQKRVRYRGGIDSDRVHLHDDATPYLADALADVTANAAVRRPQAEVLGCTLRLR